VASFPLHPPLECDVIMKGGITSGVIYPGAVCELATTYRLRSIGGASAGAIAAAAAAAAECGRATGGFEILEQLPHNITAPTAMGGSTLLRLFQPTRSTAGLFAVATSVMGRSGAGRVLAPLGAIARHFPLQALAGGLPGGVVVALGLAGSGLASGTAIVAGALMFVLGTLLGGTAGVVWRARSLSGQGFGLCSGMPGTAAFRQATALTPWLHELLQKLAGRGPDDAPLTFDDLDAAGCDLRMMTTNLNRRQPIALPWDQRTWYFDPDVFRTLFPAAIVDWMIEHPPPLPEAEARKRRSATLREQALPLRPLPAAAQLPVVVATRMSLSFPFLISAVPLHAVDYAAGGAGPGIPPTFGVNWFSDGGICSNLPVHFFDRPLPQRPTFAIDLTSFPTNREKSRDESENSTLPQVNVAGLLRRSTTWRTSGFGAIGDFASAILASARSWVDESLIVMPGYRDRVVTVWHDDEEGGLNLNMSRETVDGLAARGRGAAAKLIARFAGDEPGVTVADGWRNQQWIRLRCATRALDDWVEQFAGTFADAGTLAPFQWLAGDAANGKMPSYELTVGRRRAFNARIDALLRLAAGWSGPPDDVFTYNAPSPAPALGLIPADRFDAPRPVPDRPQTGTAP
jgi:hypothetical protein